MPVNLPYPVYGQVTQSGTAVASVYVYLRNERTGEVLNTQSSSNGNYVIDGANFTSGYELTDTFTAFVLYQNYEGEKSVSVEDGEYQANIAITAVILSTSTSYCTVQDVW